VIRQVTYFAIIFATGKVNFMLPVMGFDTSTAREFKLYNSVKSVLILDDSLSMRTLIKETREVGEINIVVQAANGEEAMDLAFELQPDFITLDIFFPI
jgi:PleD family two-component response regulator